MQDSSATTTTTVLLRHRFAWLPLAVLLVCVGTLSGFGSDAPHKSGQRGDSETRRGAAVDSITVVADDRFEAVIQAFGAGDLQLFGMGFNERSIYDSVRASERFTYDETYSNANEITLNPAGPTFRDGRLNPFYSRKIREAMNWLLDRDHIVDEVVQGMGRKRYTMINELFPDYVRLIETIRELESYYAYDFERAERVFTEELLRMGAERDAENERWTFRGQPIEIRILVRVEEVGRVRLGEYLARQLERIGFQVSRRELSQEPATRIWRGSEPIEGQWQIYTGGWSVNWLLRDQNQNFDFYYTHRGMGDFLSDTYWPYPVLWHLAREVGIQDKVRPLEESALGPQHERDRLFALFDDAFGEDERWPEFREWVKFDHVSRRLYMNDYTSMEQRNEMMAKATRLSMRRATRIWLYNVRTVWPRAHDVRVATDLATGWAGSRLWPYTLQVGDESGGDARIGMPALALHPWNPVAGSNWLFDLALMRATEDMHVMADPYTGLFHPQRIVSAEVLASRDAYVQATLDWITVESSRPQRVRVPDDAWIGWDFEEQRVVTVGERHPDGLDARARVRIRFEDDYFERRWHDGSQVSMADFVVRWMLDHERAEPQSPLYDEGFIRHFHNRQQRERGFRIVSTEPLTVEIYTEQINLDAEELVAMRTPLTAPWHTVALGILAEQRGKLAFSRGNANELGVQWMCFIRGNSLPVLERMLADAQEQTYTPFGDALTAWMREGEAEQRYDALQEWYATHEHFWLGDGPFYVSEVNLGRRPMIRLERFESFADPTDKWFRFDRPRIPEVSIGDVGIPRITQPALVDVTINDRHDGEPYPAERITRVLYLLFNDQGQIVSRGEATHRRRGTYQVRLSVDELSQLGTGRNRLEVIATSEDVAGPSIATIEFPVRR